MRSSTLLPLRACRRAISGLQEGSQLKPPSAEDFKNRLRIRDRPRAPPCVLQVILVSRLSCPSEASWDLNPSSNPKPLNPEKTLAQCCRAAAFLQAADAGRQRASVPTLVPPLYQTNPLYSALVYHPTLAQATTLPYSTTPALPARPRRAVIEWDLIIGAFIIR